MADRPSLVRRIKNHYRRNRLHRLGVHETRSASRTVLGTGSGAWTACVEPLDETSVVYSFGVGTDISFDLDVNRRTGARVHLFDPTPRSIEWMRAQELPPGIVFHEYGIGAHDGTIVFHPPRRSTSSHFSPVRRYRDEGESPVSAPVYRLGTIAQRLGHDRISLLKMDIEGGEYDVIEDLVQCPVAVDQLLVEFHHAYATIPLSRTVESLSMLSSAGFECFHISERTYEFSFLRG
jgi:FkbM family methyltransferase